MRKITISEGLWVAIDAMSSALCGAGNVRALATTVRLETAKFSKPCPKGRTRYYLSENADAGSVPGSAFRDKWPKRGTFTQNRRHLFGLLRGIEPLSLLLLLPHQFVPPRHARRG